MNTVSSKEIRKNVLSKFFHLCLPLDFIMDIWGTFRSSRSPTQEWDALGCVSHCVLVLSDTTSSQQISAVSSTTAPQLLFANPVGIPCRNPSFSTAHLHLVLRSFSPWQTCPWVSQFLNTTCFLRRAWLCWWDLPSTGGAHSSTAHGKVKSLTKSLVRKNSSL